MGVGGSGGWGSKGKQVGEVLGSAKKRSISHSLEERNYFVPKMTASSQTENSSYFLGTAVLDIRLRR